MSRAYIAFLRFLSAVVFIFVAQQAKAIDNREDSPSNGESLCPTIVKQALDATNTSCGSTRRNQVCYGNNLVRVEPQAFVSQLGFETPGDRVAIAQVRSIRGSALDIDNATWGVALMRVQANLPDALPNQNVTFLLFGDSQITETVTRDMTTMPMTANVPTNLRSRPTSSSPVLTSVPRNQTVIATGRLADNSWLRVWIPEWEGRSAWVFASLLTPSSGDINMLEVIEPSAAGPSLGPLNAFYLTTQQDETACQEFPASGLVIQTPEGAGLVRLYINEVQVDVGSTVFFQAQANGIMTISTLEGMAIVEAADHVEVAAAGSQLSIPLNTQLAPVGPPTRPQAYTQEEFQSLPIANLERPIEVAPPLSEQDITIIHDQVQADQPLCGIGPLAACSTMVVEGVIQAIGTETITVNGITIALPSDSPIRRMIAIGTRIHVEGNLESSSGLLITTKIIVLAPPAPVEAPPNPGSSIGNAPPNTGNDNGSGNTPPSTGNDNGGDGNGMGIGDENGGDGNGMGMGDD